jgi:DNA-binding transcriptional ArsR family regulator
MAERRRPKRRKDSKGLADSPQGDKSKSRKRKQTAAGSPAKKRGLPSYKLMKALGHPLRVRILAIFADRVASPKEISDELDEGISQVSYHTTVLRDHELIVKDHEVPRRGAVEHFYRAATPTVIPPNAWDDFPDVVRNSVSARILKEFLDDARASMEAGVFEDSPGELSWTPLLLDQIGIEELERLVHEFLDGALEVQTKATQRLPKEKAKRAAEARSATVFLASFLSARSPEDDKKASSRKRR